MKLNEFDAGLRVEGLLPDRTVEIIAVKNYGSALEVTYKDDAGKTGSQVIFESQAAECEIATENLPWTFTADADNFRLVSEARRMKFANLFDPYFAVYASMIDPLPHQISAVYQIMLERHPLRFLLADDPGAGKTIMAGLLIKELIVRGDLKRCLIVCPGNLVEQWQQELADKFQLKFEILTSERLEASGNIFKEINLCIARLDKLSRSESIQVKLRETRWDLIICDEAHKMSAPIFGSKVQATKRFRLGKDTLSKITRHFLLLTATPHNGKDKDFAQFMSLLDADRFEGAQRIESAPEVSDLMRRLVKEDLVNFDGTPLFPERVACTVSYDLSPAEENLYTQVTEYVLENFDRAEKLDGNRRSTVGFALTILQRRLASSPEAIYKSLERRTERLKKILAEKNFSAAQIDDATDFEDSPDYEQCVEEIVNSATAAQTRHEIQQEIAELERLTALANSVRTSAVDKKWVELSNLLQRNEQLSNSREKIIIFTEHRDTLNYLTQKISSMLGRNDAVINIHGSLNHNARQAAEKNFIQKDNFTILIATDAAGEGINLQCSHLMINYDLPWNPNRLEQRFGRIHRIGQKNVCYLWNLIAGNTREGQVFQRLFKKLDAERSALGGKVFDILGKLSFNEKPLGEFLMDAVRYNKSPKARAHFEKLIDAAVDTKKISRLLQARALTDDFVDPAAVSKNLARMEIHKLQPYYLESFFISAFSHFQGSFRRKKSGHYEIYRVPKIIRACSPEILDKYSSVCFDKKIRDPKSEFLTLGHPLFDAVVNLTLDSYSNLLRQGTIFIDDNDFSSDWHILFLAETSLADGTGKIFSKRFHFLKINSAKTVTDAGFAPCLDYRAPTDSERAKILSQIPSRAWLSGNLEILAANFLMTSVLPAYHDEFAAERKTHFDKVETAVRTRLNAEIHFWSDRAVELRQKENAGEIFELNSENASHTADLLVERRNARLAEIKLERKIIVSAPVVLGGALVIPAGALTSLPASDKKAVELAAMQAVLQYESAHGFNPRDVSKLNLGYDIESGNGSRLIEVKGRRADATTVTVTSNEIHAALNDPDKFILAIVLVDGANTQLTYLKNSFDHIPAAAVSVNFSINQLISESLRIL